ncbi:MAG TPA: YeeE/YedE family protein [Polyangiaceae bacterium]|nr:YeeE/YedE family protein [Polyangiaceae bacterium]
MKNVLSLLLCGALFGVGLVLSGMTLPSKIFGFLDVTGRWDPSLAFVMLGAIAVHAPLAWLARRRERPLLGPSFELVRFTRIDGRLVLGSALFGVGWGLGGYCPGPALVALGSLGVEPLVLVLGMLVGVAAFYLRQARRRERTGPLASLVTGDA